MSRQISKDIFIKSINDTDNAYQKFYNNHLPSYKEFYVESDIDAEFYSYFLAKQYRVNKLLKLYGCNGKKEVLRECLNYKGKKAGFIVDLDYFPFNKQDYKNIIVTSGYSMENFIFYSNGTNFNFEQIFSKISNNKKVFEKLIQDYKNELNIFIQNHLKYYAFFKTCMEFSNKYNKINNHIYLKEIDENEIDQAINLEISGLNENIKDKFISKFNDNIDLIYNSQYMLIRGHDILDHLFEFLKKRGYNVNMKIVFDTAFFMDIPLEFKNQLY